VFGLRRDQFHRDVPVPHASVSPIQIPNATWWELERRLALIYLGKSHRSSDVHDVVIRGLENAGPDCQQTERPARHGNQKPGCLICRRFTALGSAMIENTEAQARLSEALISPDATRVIEIARAHGALGWKLNGAAGDGGSVTILSGLNTSAKRAMIAALEQETRFSRTFQFISAATACVCGSRK